MNTSSTETRKPWEELDNDLELNSVAVSKEEAGAIDDALGLQMISIRLQRSLLANLKAIAQYHGVGYQPLIRDLLNRFAKSETLEIIDQMKRREAEMQQLAEHAGESTPMEPVSSFFERERLRA